MPRAWVWLQLLAGWLPVWVLYAVLISTMHDVPVLRGALLAIQAVLPAALLGLVVHRLTRRFPWPRPFRFRFLAFHVVAAAVYAATWMGSAMAAQSIHAGRLSLFAGPGVVPFLTLGVWLYVMTAGVSYAVEATERAARAEAIAARSQLASLRAQLHPHFLFNALHAVVQLIPREPARAADAAEQVAALLRRTVEEDRDLVPLAEEWAFVARYLDVERIRFGDRLSVRMEMDDAARDVLVPSFALQTLVENAVRHGAAPRVERTVVTVSAEATADALALSVRDTGDGASPEQVAGTNGGTGLARLRERLAVLYGGAARLEAGTAPGGGFAAALRIPRAAAEDAA